MRRFNVTGLCIPSEDYMVDISDKIKQISQLVDEQRYFTINRARQYGKTTTLNQLRVGLADKYVCIDLSFEGLGGYSFESEEIFCQTFIRCAYRRL